MDINSYYPRDLERELEVWLERPEGILIYGARQVGKSTLLKKLSQKYLKVNFLSFDVAQTLNWAKENPLGFLQQSSLNIDAIVLDEFQKVPEITTAIKHLVDTQKNKCKFLLSGSISDALIKGGDSMVGRVMRFPLYSLSFSEFLLARGNKLPEIDWEKASPLTLRSDLLEKLAFLQAELETYLKYGGYPATVTRPPEFFMTYFEGLRRGFLEKDLLGRLRLGQVDNLEKLLTILAKRVGSPVSYNGLANDLGIDTKTVKNLISILAFSYWIEIVRPQAKYGSEFKNKFKIYFLDNGLRNYLAKNNFEIEGLELGAVFENCVFGVLRRFFPVEISFWRTYGGGEVDFVITRGDWTIAVEVKSKKMKRAEIPLSLRNYIDKYHPQEAFIINRDYFGEEQMGKTKIKWLPLYLFASWNRPMVKS